MPLRSTQRSMAWRWTAVLGPVFVLLGLLTACDEPGHDLIDTETYATSNGGPGATREAGGAEFGTDPEAPRPVEIYYDLTAYDWYRRGEPLIVDGREYHPSSIPEAERARSFEPAGTHMGVGYYVLEGAGPPHPTVYIPVAPGYWLPFTTTGASGENA